MDGRKWINVNDYDLDVYQNYDAVFKDALTLFKDKTLAFLGVELDTKITEILRSSGQWLN